MSAYDAGLDEALFDAWETNLFPDGFQYGVRFGDGSVAARWNGRTQRERAQAEVERLSKEYAPDRFSLVRRRPGGAWEVAE